MAQYTYSNFIVNQAAPREAASIGVYSGDTRMGSIPLGVLGNYDGAPLYKFGLLSDIHVDTTDYNYAQYLAAYPYSDEGAGDLRRALRWFRDHEQVDLVCACGDLSQYGGDSEFEMSSTEIANEIPNIPFYTCTGNHDVYSSHSGAATFKNYFNNRTIDTTSYSISSSTAYDNSFYFTKSYTDSNNETKTDVFVFFSMYNYSASNAYLDADLNWLTTVLAANTDNRVFLFTHLFFPDYAGNLGRVNGSGGIYPSGNWLSGTGLTKLKTLLSTYANVFWFSGHSHWKWDLQKYQKNANVDYYSGGTDPGAWTIHVPSLALPIDSDYTNTSQETSANRVEKPLESQGGVVDVYEDHIVLRGIDFNINTSQNGDTAEGYSGDTYVRYLPVAGYYLENHSGTTEDPRPSSEYVIISNIGENAQKSGSTVHDPYVDYGIDYVDYVAFTFTKKSSGFWVTSPTYDSTLGSGQTAVVALEDLKVFSGAYSAIDITTAEEISLPSYLGFYNGTDYTDAERYQIVDGFVPSTWENNSLGRCQLQTSSSYVGGIVTVLLKVKLNYTSA